VSARIAVNGDSALADGLRDGLSRLGHELVSSGSLDAMVVVHRPAGEGRAIEEYSDAEFDAAWEQPLRATVAAFLDARTRGARRLVVVTTTAGMTGAEIGAPDAMAADALRALVKSTARQWGTEGITVNTVAVDPGLAGATNSAVSLAPPALGGPGDPRWDIAPLVAACCSDDFHHLTGATLTADGGSWMP